MSNEQDNQGKKIYEGWTESEKAVDIFFEQTLELNTVFKDAVDALANPVWFLNGKAAVILEKLQQKREILALLQQRVTEGEVPQLIAECLGKADEYIASIEAQFRDPAVRKRIAQVKDRIRKTWN